MSMKLSGLGKCFGGMDGSASSYGKRIIFRNILSILRDKLGVDGNFEFIDIGAGDGIMVCLAMFYGAASAVGVELQDAKKYVFDQYQESLKRVFGVDVCDHVSVVFGCSSSNLEHLPTLCLDQVIPRIALCFCDGFNEGDRRHVFQNLIGLNPSILIFLCSPGKARGDCFFNHNLILEALNFHRTHEHKFQYHGVFTVKMAGSGRQKSLLMFYCHKKTNEV